MLPTLRHCTLLWRLACCLTLQQRRGCREPVLRQAAACRAELQDGVSNGFVSHPSHYAQSPPALFTFTRFCMHGFFTHTWTGTSDPGFPIVLWFVSADWLQVRTMKTYAILQNVTTPQGVTEPDNHRSDTVAGKHLRHKQCVRHCLVHPAMPLACSCAPN